MDNRLDSYICNSDIQYSPDKILISNGQKRVKAEPGELHTDHLMERLFSEHLKGLVFVIVVMMFTLLVPKTCTNSEKLSENILKNLIRMGDIILSVLGMILMSPLAVLICLFIRMISYKDLIARQFCVAENRRKKQRRILNVINQKNDRYHDRRRLKLPGKIVGLYSFNCEKLKENCDNELFYCIRKKIILFGLDKIPRLYNIFKGEISLFRDFRLRPLYVRSKDVVSA